MCRCDCSTATTTSVAELENDFDLAAVALAVSLTCSPGTACLPTLTATCSSSASPVGTLPTLQVVPLDCGQTVKAGFRTPVADAT